MSTKQKKTPSVRADGFHGIRFATAMDGIPNTVDIQNFRITGDGSLIKRNGYSPLHVSKNEIRASIVTQFNQIPYVFLLRANQVYLVNLKTEESRLCGQIQSSSGNAHFFYHQGTLFLLCDSDIYIVDENTVERTIGYIPLVAKDWPNTHFGEINEPRNLLHNQARMTYIIQDPPTVYLRSPYKIKSVERVLRNNVEQTKTEDYYLDLEFNTVNILRPKSGDRVTVYLTFEDDPSLPKKDLYSCDKDVLFGNTDASRILLFGGNTHATVFCASYVPKENLLESKSINALSSPLYFREGCDFTVGNGQFRIQGATHDRDRIVFFTEGNTWIAKNVDTDKEKLSTCGMNPIGCATPNGVVQAANDPITVEQNTIYRWESTSDGNLRAVSISKSVAPYWDKDFYSRAQLCFDPANNELWVNDTGQNMVWICRLDSGDWFRYTDIPADRLMWLGDRMGFTHSSTLYQFSNDQYRDVNEAQNTFPIQAYYQASLGDLGSSDIKTVTHITFHGVTHTYPVLVSLFGGDLREPISASFTTNDATGSTVSKKRCRSGRFRCANLSISANGNSPLSVRRISIHTQ